MMNSEQAAHGRTVWLPLIKLIDHFHRADVCTVLAFRYSRIRAMKLPLGFPGLGAAFRACWRRGGIKRN